MKKTPRSFIDFRSIKSQVTITQVLEHYGLQQRFVQSSTTDEWRACCPLHDGDNPTEFSINTDKNVWNCFSDCHRGGNVLDFVSVKEGVTIHEAGLLLNQWFNLGLTKSESRSRQNPRPARKKDRTTASQKSNPQTSNPPLGFELKNLDFDHSYLRDRGIQPEVAQSFGMGFCSRGSMAGRIAIPLHNAEGQLVGYIGRWPGDPPEDTPKYKLPKGFQKSLELFNIHRALDSDPTIPLVIVEGVFDVIALSRAGYPKCVALLGSSLSRSQESLLIRLADSFPLITLFLDEDEAGQHGRDDALLRLAHNFHVKTVCLPDEGSQPEDLSMAVLDELLFQRNHGEQQLEKSPR